MKRVSKIIIKSSVKFYAIAWSHRNEIMHKAEVCRKFIIEWCNNIKQIIDVSKKL